MRVGRACGSGFSPTDGRPKVGLKSDPRQRARFCGSGFSPTDDGLNVGLKSDPRHGARFCGSGFSPTTPRRTHGFTLVELIVALAISVALLATVPIAFGKLSEASAYRAAVREMLAGLRATRNEAALHGHPATFTVDLRQRTYAIDQGRPRDLPDGIGIDMIVAYRDAAGTTGGIRFYPDGSSSGGTIQLTRADGSGVALKVDWLLGRVTQETVVP